MLLQAWIQPSFTQYTSSIKNRNTDTSWKIGGRSRPSSVESNWEESHSSPFSTFSAFLAGALEKAVYHLSMLLLAVLWAGWKSWASSGLCEAGSGRRAPQPLATLPNSLLKAVALCNACSVTKVTGETSVTQDALGANERGYGLNQICFRTPSKDLNFEYTNCLSIFKEKN